MLTSIEDFVRYYQGVNRRAMRDVAALPPEAEGWRPPAGEGEQAWDIGQLVGHIVDTRRMFLSVYRDEGWRMALPVALPRVRWVPELEHRWLLEHRRVGVALLHQADLQIVVPGGQELDVLHRETRLGEDQGGEEIVA